MVDLSTYTLEQLLRDSQLVVYRGRGRGTLGHILVVAPLSERFEHETIKRLEREYALRTKLDSAWAAVPIALVRDKGRTALVLADPGGEPLERLLEHPLELTRFLQIGVGLAGALSGLHKRGIVHKDIKPGNVLVDAASGQVWLTGFGKAISLARAPQAPEPAQTIAGTLAYIALEQTGRMNRSIDSRSDLYSLGIILYQMLTGTLPFVASDPLELVHCHIARLPAPPEERRKEVPATLSAIVLKLLAKIPEDRYQTAAGLEADLRRCLDLWEARGRIDAFIIGTHDTSERLMIPEKLYGRARESRALVEAFDRIAASGRPELVLVSGHAGIGKSSVVNELHKIIVPPRGIFASGKFDQYKRDIPYATLAQAFQTQVRQILSKNEAELRRWRDAIQDAVGQNGQLIVNLIPELELLIGKQAPAPELPRQEAENRFQAVLRAFLSVFARDEHPLVLFLDDLQWLDAATLKLLEHLIVHPDVRYLLVIGAYRDNGVSPSHPLMLALDSIRKTGAIVGEIVLAPLSFDDLSELIADSLHQELALIEPLARLVLEKTAGNPLFVSQFLTSLAEARLVEFDQRESVWRWHIERIRALRITDNVVDLVVSKLTRLSDSAREVLKQFACLGNSAEVVALTTILARPEDSIRSDLQHAVDEGFLIRVGESYKFVHDRIQEAAYTLIPDGMRAQVHLRIGRLLMARVRIDDIPENLFDVVNQVNRGVALISDANEKQRVAELNFSAGKKAKTSTAYAAACRYLSIAMTLLGHEYWNSEYDIAYKLWLERAECEFLSGNFDEAETLISELLVRSSSRSDKAAAYCLRIDLHVMKSEEPRAVACALECLRLFGIEMSAHPGSEQVQVEYEKVWRNVGERSIESLIDLPPMRDAEMQAAMRVLSVFYGPAFTLDNNLFYLCVCHMVNISLKYGITDASAHGLALFGRILGPLHGLYRDGYLFGKLGVELVEKNEFIAYRAKVYFTTALAAVWTQPVSTVIELLRAALRAGVETGDPVYVSYCYDLLVANLVIRGDHLDEVWQQSEKGLDFRRQVKYLGTESMVSEQQFIRCMQGRTATFSSFSDAHFDETVFEEHLTAEAAQMATVTCWYWILKLQAWFVSGHYEAAVAAAERTKPVLWASVGCIQLLDYHYYSALTIAVLFDEAPVERQREWREALSTHLEQLREWADNYPPTFRDKHLLVEAEIARIDNRELEAMRLYEQAIKVAHDNGFAQNEGIANEIAGRFYLEHGLRTAGQNYLRNARYCYLLWGAHAKVNQLDQLYPGLERETPPLETATINPSIEQLDLTTIVRPLQAVSREIDFEKLIEIVMTNVLEHAGAERGLLFLRRGSELRIEAQAMTHSNKVEVILAASMAMPPQFAETILDHVVRTLESIIVEDGSAPGRFSDDAYVLTRRPRSILCLHLLLQRESIGVLYLENNLAPNVFSKDRLAVLELIASQAAISLNNAQLYADLQQENDERRKAEIELRQSTDALSHLQEELRQASRAAMMGELTASLAHELNQPLGGSLINAQAVHRLLTKKKPDLVEIKAAIEEIISDNTRAVEIIRNVRSLFQRDDAEMGPVDLMQVLFDVARILAADAVFRQVTLRSNLPAILPTIIGNRTQLLQALMNLVLNALDAVCEEGVEIREVEIHASEPEPGQIHVAVSDSGKGIDDNVMPRLFDAFFTTKAKGMGMGLAIVRSIVDNHGGRLWATRNSSGGATLEFELPVKGECESRN